MAAFGKQVKLIPSVRDRLPDQFLAVGITFCGVNHIQPRIQRAAQQPLHIGERSPLKSDLRPAEAQRADFQACPSQCPSFHKYLPA